MDTDEKCRSLIDVISKLSPSLSPIVLPNGYTPKNVRCECPSPRPEICSTPNCTQPISPDTLPHGFWRIDISHRSVVLADVRYCCQLCQDSACLELMLSTCPTPLIEHFVVVNRLLRAPGETVEEPSGSDWSAGRFAAQRVFCAAYALKILLSRLPSALSIDLNGFRVVDLENAQELSLCDVDANRAGAGDEEIPNPKKRRKKNS